MHASCIVQKMNKTNKKSSYKIKHKKIQKVHIFICL